MVLEWCLGTCRCKKLTGDSLIREVLESLQSESGKVSFCLCLVLVCFFDSAGDVLLCLGPVVIFFP